MEHAWFWLVVFLLVALVFSFLCSILEAVVLSITPSFIAAHEGPFGDSLARMKRDIDRPLSAILTLNTFAHTIGAAGVGAAAQHIWGEAALTVVSAVVTVIILIGSEIIPKTIGAVYWQQLAKPVVFLVKWLTILLLPLVIVCQLITKLLRRGEEASVLSRADLSNVANLGYRDGLLNEHERQIIANLMAKDELQVAKVMTPKERLVAIASNENLRSIHARSPAWHVSRIPVYEGNDNKILGYVLKDEVLAAIIAGRGEETLATLAHPVIRVRGDNSLVELYGRLVKQHEHIAMVEDETGKTLGIVTMEDLIEELLGQEIVDESDRARGVLD